MNIDVEASMYIVGGEQALIPRFQSCSMQDACDYLRQLDIICIDTETEGLDFMSKKILMVQVGDEDRQFIIDVRTKSKTELELLADVLNTSKAIKILHNAKFDYKFLKKYLGISLRNIYDTFLVEKVLHCGKDNYGFGLAKLVERYCNVTLNKTLRKDFTDMSGAPFTGDQMIYGARDIVYLKYIYRAQQIDIENKNLQNVVTLENKAVVAFSEIEYEGLMINLPAWKKLAIQNKIESVEVEKNLDKILLSDTRFEKYKAEKQLDLFLDESELKASTVQWGSPLQVLKVFRQLVPSLENVNGKKLLPHKYQHPLIAEYIKFKEKDKLASAFGDNFDKCISSDGKVHTTFTQILDTGRVSSSEPNMQQIPAINEYRNCFVAPEGHVFVSSDYSSQELNVIAFGSGDPVFTEALRKGEDLHSVCAEVVFKEKWTSVAEPDCLYMSKRQKCECKAHKQLRTQVKTINFGLAYGMGPGKLAENVRITTAEAKDLIKTYFKSFPKIEAFLTGLGKFGVMNGYITTFPPFNRKRWFSEWQKDIHRDETKSEICGRIERASKNTPIQGSSADITKLALIYIFEYLEKNNLLATIKLVMQVHDQIDSICPVEMAEEWKSKMTELMEIAANKVVTNGLLKSETSITVVWSK